MSEKMLIVIFWALNLGMWFFFIESMVVERRNHLVREQKLTEFIQKQTDYMHLIHKNVYEMNQVEVSAMQQFLKEMSVKIKEGDKADETENRE
ncbi:MAG: hypothetical protein J6W04_02090 [Bacteroidales bacterium]|nr:hypothetical protein [Bacteroidales bacterium]